MKKININTATASALTNLKGIGPSIAKRILEYRKKNGLFKRKDQIKNVNGISDLIFDDIKESIIASVSRDTTIKKTAQQKPTVAARKTSSIKKTPRRLKAVVKHAKSKSKSKTTVKPQRSIRKRSTRKKQVKSLHQTQTTSKIHPAKLNEELRSDRNEKRLSISSVENKSNIPSNKQRASDYIAKKLKKKKSNKKVNSKLTKTKIKAICDSKDVDFKEVKKILKNGVKKGFTTKGDCIIKFDTHLFYKLLKKAKKLSKKQLNKNHKFLSSKKQSLKKQSQQEAKKLLKKAKKVNKNLALKASYFGLFQIAGKDYKKAGFNSLKGFIKAQSKSEKQQLKSFIKLYHAKK